MYIDDLNIIGTIQDIHESRNHLNTNFKINFLDKGILVH